MKINLSTRDQPASQLSSIVRYCEGRREGDEISSIRFRDGIKSGFPTVFPNIIRVPSYYNLPSPFFVIRAITRGGIR